MPSQDEHGREVRLADFYHDGFTLVYFYPKADTPGCTAQACNLRDGFAELTAKGVKIVGVSADSPESQLKFKEKYKLPFSLLADEERTVIRAFGVPTVLEHHPSPIVPDQGRQNRLARSARLDPLADAGCGEGLGDAADGIDSVVAAVYDRRQRDE